MKILRSSFVAAPLCVLVVVACSSDPAVTSPTTVADTGTNTTADTTVPAKQDGAVAVQDGAVAVQDAATLADGGQPQADAAGVSCTGVGQCKGADAVCCVRLDLGPELPGKTYPQCTTPSGSGTCADSVKTCAYNLPLSCNSQFVSHACASTADCTESNAKLCCDVSRNFKVPDGSRVCLGTLAARILESQVPGACSEVVNE